MKFKILPGIVFSDIRPVRHSLSVDGSILKSLGFSLLLLVGLGQSTFTMENIATRRLIFGLTQYGGIGMVEQGLADGADVNYAHDNLWTPLHYAADKGDWKIVQLLLKNGADVTRKNNFGKTAFDLANKKENCRCRRGCGYESKCHYCYTASLIYSALKIPADIANADLCQAAYDGDLDKARDALNRKADINYGSGSVDTPLHLASFGGHQEMVKLLLNKGADINSTNEYGGTPLHRASAVFTILKL